MPRVQPRLRLIALSAATLLALYPRLTRASTTDSYLGLDQGLWSNPTNWLAGVPNNSSAQTFGVVINAPAVTVVTGRAKPARRGGLKTSHFEARRMDAVDGVGPSNPPLGAEAVVAGAASPATGPASDCEPYRALIGEKLAQGLSGRRIYQDLAAEHGAGGGGSGGIPSYDSIKRFLRHLGKTTPLAYRRMEVAPGQESQVDFGSGAPILGASGKPRAFTVNNSSKPSRRLPAALLQPPRSRSAAYCRNRSTPLGATLRL